MNKICVQQIKEKRKREIKQIKSKLFEGMEVTVNGGDLDGEKGIVTNVKRTRALVVVDGKEWDVPIMCITPLDPEDVNVKPIEQLNPEDL